VGLEKPWVCHGNWRKFDALEYGGRSGGRGGGRLAVDRAIVRRRQVFRVGDDYLDIPLYSSDETNNDGRSPARARMSNYNFFGFILPHRGVVIYSPIV
jgi:hypothetical protein